MGLDVTKDSAPWRGQHPKKMQDRPQFEGWAAFDARGIRDLNAREMIWQAVAAVLAGYREPASVMAQAELEPSVETVWDAYFLVNASTQSEGVLWRFAKANTPGDLVLNAFAQRAAGSGQRQVTLWISPGVDGTPPLTLYFSQRAARCELTTKEGLKEAMSRQEASCELALNVLFGVLFEGVSGPAYLSDSDVDTAVTHWPVDLKRRDRTIDEVFTDSAFPPRMSFQK